jgi:hypothetical protein
MHRLVLVFAFIVQFPSGVRQHQAVKLDQLGTRALESPDHASFRTQVSRLTPPEPIR